MQNSKQLSIIIVNYRSEGYLKGCIASIYNKINNYSFEIIVVNNDPEMVETRLIASLPAGRDIKIINNKKNLGFGSANNIGAKQAQGEYLLLLNPDTQIETSNFEEMLERILKDGNVGAIAPKLVTEEGKVQPWCAGKEPTLKRLIKNNFGIIESKKIWESQDEISADWVSGAVLLVKKEIFEKVNGFDENFFMYFEDLDLCQKIRQAGFGVLYYPRAQVLHYGGQSRESFFQQKKQFFKSMLYFYKR